MFQFLLNNLKYAFSCSSRPLSSLESSFESSSISSASLLKSIYSPGDLKILQSLLFTLAVPAIMSDEETVRRVTARQGRPYGTEPMFCWKRASLCGALILVCFCGCFSVFYGFSFFSSIALRTTEDFFPSLASTIWFISNVRLCSLFIS